MKEKTKDTNDFNGESQEYDTRNREQEDNLNYSSKERYGQRSTKTLAAVITLILLISIIASVFYIVYDNYKEDKIQKECYSKAITEHEKLQQALFTQNVTQTQAINIVYYEAITALNYMDCVNTN